MKLVLDVENTVAFVKVSEKETIKVASPYHPDNKLVAVGFREIGDKTHTATFHHNQMESTPGGFILTQKALHESKVLIGHNLKHDLSWLLECGFTYTGTYWDTMLVEYILSKGMKLGLSLGDCVARAKLEGHKGDVMKKYLADKINVDDMPYEELIEYLVNDVEITEMLYLNQLERLDRLGETEKAHLMKAINLVNTFLPYLVEMERAGIYVDQQELGVLKQGYLDELNQLNNKLTTKVRELMGDKPYNLNSSDDLSAILYSRRPRNKKVWVERFNIGSELRNGVSKPKRLNIFKGEGFSRMLTQEMLVEQKCTARKCRNCNGVGTIYRTKKDGTRYANPNICHACERSGVEYIKSGEVAGLKLRPKNEFAKQAGFATDGPAIDYYLERKIPEEAREFLTALRRRSKLDTWVNTFCAQLQKFNINGLVHPSFNQHITATGRLSCSAPNMQNQPKRDKDFTLRKAFKSRFVGGRLYEADFGQLEFRIAALLANCVSAIKFIEEGKDIHAVTRDFFYGELELKPSDPWEKIDPKEDRQEAKAETFGPLYGKMTEWANQFYIMFPGIAKWHESLMVEAATYKQTVSPSGRIYAFPYAERFVNRNGKVLTSGHTQIKNYSVQGFATGDLVLLVLMDIMDYLQSHNAKSRLCLQVHDSALVDAHPEEFPLVEKAFDFAFNNIYKKAKDMFGIDINVPLAFDLEWGVNWYGDK